MPLSCRSESQRAAKLGVIATAARTADALTMASVPEWDGQLRLVRVNHEHREQLGRLRLAGLPLRPARPFPTGFGLQPLDRSSTENYRTLFRAVGTDWLWFSRLIMPEEKLRAILDDPQINIFVLRREWCGIGTRLSRAGSLRVAFLA